MYIHHISKIIAMYIYMDVGIGVALSQLGWWGGTFLMGEVGPVLFSSPLKIPGTFYLFAVLYILAFLHVLLLLPETKVCVNCHHSHD